jgi:hypothetical protein
MKLIAERLYGDAGQVTAIEQANPALKGEPNPGTVIRLPRSSR